MPSHARRKSKVRKSGTRQKVQARPKYNRLTALCEPECAGLEQSTATMPPAQGFISSYAPRLRQYSNAFLTPVLQTQTIAPASRLTKRGTTIINYADDAYDDDDFDSEDTRRATGLRSLRREDLEKREAHHDRLGQEIYEPVNIQGVYREWMIRRAVKPTYENMPSVMFYMEVLTRVLEPTNKSTSRRNCP
jgi:hypothetical protein